MLLKDRVAIVTGAASPRGIGLATARALAAQGARIAILDLNEEAVQRAAGELGKGHRGYRCDVSSHEQCRKVVAAIQSDLGPVDSLLAFAGISRSTRFLDVTPEEYEAVMQANLRGTMNICQAVVPGMIEKGGGSIVCVGSIAAQRGGGVFGGTHYSASKGGVQSLAKAMARELAPRNIRVNAVAPGLIETDIFEGKLTETRKAEIAATIPMGRVGQPRDVADVCVFLVSDWASYVTGVVLDINGGLHIH
ncbi:MAG TPA: SDR family oxidoreductase [Hypericibacter adhaerens]|jgi:NAD(P)-dependent dehydrogenase (short-subunit alcohol dehydrogenase family)|uniref:SDR family NAD(P)-dependent oxidoreductase n=1 Tax=Hypericibacter adhaerens TaxID=2602016 RepID=UPI002CFD2CF8|nr:SDR family oxidoreductase [Hypericibacter adhaerens]HWA45869.1 SDR family oxidoreductase [Hypericibacter adhaerens]